MALTLDGSVSATDRQLAVNETVPEDIGPDYLFRIDDEVLRLVQFVSEDPPNPRPIDRQLWYVERAYGGSVAASHDNGVEIKGARDAWTSSSDEEQPDPFPAGDTLSSDIVAALEAADSPSAANPFVTGRLRSKTITVNSAALLALHTSPPVVVPLVAGEVHIPLTLTFVARFATQAYTWTDLPFLTDGNATLWLWAEAGGFGGVLGSSETSFGMAVNAGGYGQEVYNVADLTLDADSSPTGGDGSLDITVDYLVIDL